MVAVDAEHKELARRSYCVRQLDRSVQPVVRRVCLRFAKRCAGGLDRWLPHQCRSGRARRTDQDGVPYTATTTLRSRLFADQTPICVFAQSDMIAM